MIGLISDTHGLLRPEAREALRGAELIVHAGDVGKPEVLEGLRTIAPVVAIRGNVDRGNWCEGLPRTAVVETPRGLMYVLHDVKELDVDPISAGFAFVVSGHSHKPLDEERRGVRFINPGAAGPRRFKLPITVVRLRFEDASYRVEFVDLTGGT